jgi:hypothetical protein
MRIIGPYVWCPLALLTPTPRLGAALHVQSVLRRDYDLMPTWIFSWYAFTAVVTA